MVQVVDFSRAVLFFQIDTLKKPPRTMSHQPPYSLNTPRVPLVSICTIDDSRTGTSHRFVQGDSCKTERVGVDRDIWMEPNADFIPVASADHFLAIKTFARAGTEIELWPIGRGIQGERQIVSIEDAFDRVWVEASEVEGSVLGTGREVVEAVLANERIVARTTYSLGSYKATVEYPVRTVNANSRDWVYQTDTGPILFPDLTREPADLLAGMELAFIASNSPDWVECIVRVPTEIAEGVSVWHYSRSVRLDARTTYIRIR